MAELNADLVPPSAGAVPIPASDKRARTLTSKGQEQYDKHLLRLKDKYDHTWREIERIMYSVDDENSDVRYLRDIDDSVHKLYSNLLIDSNVITEFLENQRTEPASHDMVAHMNNNSRRTDLVRRFRSRIEDMLLSEAESYSERLETKSVASLSASSSVARKQMNASMKKAELAFLDKEVELQKQRLELQKQTVDIELKALQQRKMSALADAEVKVIEFYEPDDYGKDDFESQRSLRRIKQERVVDFVSNSQCNIGNNVDNVSRSYPKLVPNAGASSSPGCKAWAADHELSVSSIPPPILNPNSSVFRPGSCAPYIPYHDNQSSVVQDMSKYLLKKELLMVGFSAFDDTAQHFNVWRGAFINIVREIQATPLEELDLLTKWLGPDSRNFAISIRATNLSDPERGLTLIWKRLRDLYGRPEIREAALKRRLNDIPKLTDNDHKQYYKLVDVLTEIDSAKCDEQFKTLLSYYDSSVGVLPIVAKLPRGIQESWCVRASQYKAQNNAPFPPFSFFLRFVREVCERKNDPSLDFSEFGNRGPSESEPKWKTFNYKLTACKSEIVSSELSDVNDNSNNFLSKRCPIHHANHALTGCRSFLAMPLEKRRDYLKNNDLCFRCCVGKHRASKCQDNEIKCGKCLSNRHITCMHYDRPKSDSRLEHGGESATPSHQSSGQMAINTKCSELCGDSVGGRSCGKLVLVKVYQANDPKLAIRTYAIIDDQSNKTLARSKFFDTFRVNGETSVFTMSSCSGSLSYSGRTANNFIVEPICGSAQLCLSTIIECDDIPNNVQEIPTPEVAIAYPHLTEIAEDIPDLDPMSEILLLIGRDVPPAHHVIKQKVGPKNGPFAQRLVLGWTIIGDVCLGGIHKPNRINVMKTNVLGNGRNSVCRPCDSQLTVSRVEQMELPTTSRHTGSTLACDIFKTTHFDETPSFSTEDRQFLALMNDEMEQNKDGKWTAPLPFRNDRPRLPNNRSHALKRAIMFDQNLQKNPTKQYHAVEFMRNIFQRGHAELAPPLSAEEECWYLPIFGVYHPHKLDKIRMVFDSSAKYHDMSLNSALLTGPDLTNSLMGVLMRFRIGPVAVTADIEQMFHCFAVSKKHRNFLRFLWYKDNDPQKPLTEYRMCVHVFGNSPSPAVATYGLRRAVLEAEPRFGSDVRGFIDKNFYVDDGLISLSSADQVVDLLHRTKEALRTHGQLRLHKFASNDPVVMQSFEPQDLAKDIVNVDLGREELPTQGSLGLVWDLQLDSFTFRLNPEEKTFHTQRCPVTSEQSL